MSMNLIIADTNQDYVERLKDYILNKYQDQYIIELIYDKYQLKERIKQGKCQVVLLTPNLYDPEMNIKNIELPIILVDEEAPLPYPDKFKRSINKYTRITSLMLYVEEEYEEMERNKPIIYGVYSPAGGVGKTTIALSAAIAYAQAGKKVLYFNLEDLDSTPMFFEKAEVPPMEVLLNLAKDSYEQMLAKRIGQDKRTGVMYFTREVQTLDPYAISAEEVSRIVETLIESGMANIVIIDLSTELNFLNRQVFEMADYLMMVVNQNTQSTYKTNCFMAQDELIEPIRNKIKFVINQGKEFSINQDVEVIARIDKLYATNPLGLCEYIAQNHFLSLHGLNEQ